jgi:hypothetical protein
MATANIVVGSPINIQTPPQGEATLFVDTSNQNILSIKYADGTVKVYSSENLEECCSCEIAKKYMSDIACALKTGMLKPSDFTNLVNVGLSVTATEKIDAQGNKICTVDVGPKKVIVPPTSIVIVAPPPNNPNLPNRVPVPFYAEFTPANTTNKSVVWTSSNPNIATINQNGLLTPTEVGTLTIYAYSVDDSTVFGQRTITII